MTKEMDRDSGKKAPGQPARLCARLIEGKWYCGCDQPARCTTSTNSGHNKGRRFWICAKPAGEQCAFFLWADVGDAIKEGFKLAQLPPAPQTPTKTGGKFIEPDISPQLLETPFTKAKRKGVPKDVVNHDTRDEHNSGNPNACDSPLQSAMATDLHQSSEYTRKAARTSTISTPGQNFTERLKTCTLPLPTPNSHDHIPSHPRPLQQLDTSPTPNRFNDMTSLIPSEESDLTTKVLELVRADKPKLKASTELLLSHEINLVLDVSESKLRRHEATISELRKRIDELENMVLLLTQ